MIRPFICTCDKRMNTFKKFVASYLKQAKKSLKRPVVFYDGESKEYHDLIDLLNPIEKIKQSEKGLGWNCLIEFPKIINESKVYRDEIIIFLEDDIYFSSKFNEGIKEVENQIKSYHVVDIVTLFGSGNCYWPKENNKAGYPIYRFSGKDYYGNLAVVFRPSLMKWWYDNREKIWNNKYCGWDIKIGCEFQDNGFNFYCTDPHYVQHQVGHSVIANEFKDQTSNLFRR